MNTKKVFFKRIVVLTGDIARSELGYESEPYYIHATRRTITYYRNINALTGLLVFKKYCANYSSKNNPFYLFQKSVFLLHQNSFFPILSQNNLIPVALMSVRCLHGYVLSLHSYILSLHRKRVRLSESNFCWRKAGKYIF